ncbi:MAG: hypothetical protein A3E01_02720 [Gammaproteobacteria bacterium RIFCSPHIGHO2_12_FULL_63_22]|nr:MAG: hypothetical protein A3E01_02720 [Gammaproteobacteria bacterium RIFCSPHIGHO2_12_FULL_63_22]
MSFIAGAYTVTYNALALGQARDGYRLRVSPAVEEITGDNYGDTVQDGVYRGGSCFLQMDLLEYNAAAIQTAMWPYGTFGTLGVIGRLQTALAKQIVMTAVAGTPAASTPATVTFARAILAPGQQTELLFAPRLRIVPIMFQILPDGSGNWFTTT